MIILLKLIFIYSIYLTLKGTVHEIFLCGSQTKDKCTVYFPFKAWFLYATSLQPLYHEFPVNKLLLFLNIFHDSFVLSF